MENDKNFDSDDEFWLAYVEAKSNSKTTASMRVNDCDVKFQIDTGAEINPTCQKYVKKTQVNNKNNKIKNVEQIDIAFIRRSNLESYKSVKK